MTEAAKKARSEYNRQWQKAHPEKAKEHQRRYRQSHPEVFKAANERYWERKAAKLAEGGGQE